MSFAWAAGLYEGEGSLTKRKGKIASYELKIKMTDLDVLQRFQSVFNLGSINPVNSPSVKPHWKQCWVLSICNKPGIYRVLQAMMPHLGVRRSYDALNCLDTIDGITAKPHCREV